MRWTVPRKPKETSILQQGKNGAIILYITKDKPVKGYREWQKTECVSNSGKEIETLAASNDSKILYQLSNIF